MKKKLIITISGSIRKNSTNKALLNYLPKIESRYEFKNYDLEQLPLFHPDKDVNPLPANVAAFRQTIAAASAVIISSPEYLYNIPAVLKNALEWLSSSGELYDKKVIAIIYTPNTPRGQKAMESLLFTLKAINASVLTSMDLYHTDISFDQEGNIVNDGGVDVLAEVLDLL